MLVPLARGRTYSRTAGAGALIPWGSDALLLILFTLIQIGYSYWLSVASVAAVIMIIRLRVQLAVGFRARPWILFLPLLMAVPLAFERSADLTQDILRTAREALIACLMIVIIAGATLRPPSVNIRRFTQCLTLIAGFLFVLTLVQLVALKRGLYLGLPEQAYANGAGTIPNALDLRYSQLRPAGTFSEPSYLAFIMLSMLMIAAARLDRDRRGIVTAGLAFLTGLLSQAASFVLFAAVMGAAFIARTIRGRNKLLLLLLLAIAAIVAFGVATLVLGVELKVVNRVQGGSSGGDFSIFVRIFGPATILPSYLVYHPVGLPVSAIHDAIAPFSKALGIDPDQYLMNSLFNLFFEYGVLGAPLAVLLIMRRDQLISLYLLSCMMLNGAFLAIDKLAVICMTIAIYQAIRHHPAERNLLDDPLRGQIDTLPQDRAA